MLSQNHFPVNRLDHLAFNGYRVPVAPEPVLQVTPVAEVAVVGNSSSGKTEAHRVGVSFNKQTDDMLALRLVVQNTSNDKILLSPESVTYQYCRQPLQPGNQIECIKKSPVVDPELAIFDNRREQNHRLAVHAAHERSQAVMGTLNLMTGAMAAASGDTEAIEEVLENQRDLKLTSLSKSGDSTRGWKTGDRKGFCMTKPLERRRSDQRNLEGLLLIPLEQQAQLLFVEVNIAGTPKVQFLQSHRRPEQLKQRQRLNQRGQPGAGPRTNRKACASRASWPSHPRKR